MTSNWKSILKTTLLGLVLFALGFASGLLVATRRIAHSSHWMSDVARNFIVNQYSFMQYKEAEYSEAKAALMKYMHYLDGTPARSKSWQPGENPWLDDRLIAFDKALTYARLALLEERNGHQTDAAKYWSDSQVWAGNAKWKDTSLEHIRTIILRMDSDASKMWDSEKQKTH